MGARTPQCGARNPRSVPIKGHMDRKTPIWGQGSLIWAQGPLIWGQGPPPKYPYIEHENRKTPIWGQDP